LKDLDRQSIDLYRPRDHLKFTAVMRFSLLAALSSLATLTFADVQITSPAAGAKLTGGGAITIQWKDSGESPALSTFSTYTMFLCAGGNEDGTFVRSDMS